MSASECVKVVVRIRPLSDKEVADGRKETIRANSERAEVRVESVASATEAPKTFTFDATYGSDSKQEQIYDSAAYPIVESVLKGFNGTILAVRARPAVPSCASSKASRLPAHLPILPVPSLHILSPPPPPPRSTAKRARASRTRWRAS